MLNVANKPIMLNVVMPNVVMLSVVAPTPELTSTFNVYASWSVNTPLQRAETH
jgi:hypothetical protein